LTIRLGMLGAGAIAAEHSRAFARLGCELVVIMSTDAAQANGFAGEFGFATSTTDLSEVLKAPNVDAIIVASPNGVHAAQTSEAIRNGKHVLCEIPLGLSMTDISTIRAASEAHPELLCMTCHTEQFIEPIARLAIDVQNESLDPISLTIFTGLPRRSNIGWTGRIRRWVDNIVWHHGVHAIDTALFLLNDHPETVLALTGPMNSRTGLPMDLSIAIRTKTGRLATMSLSYNADQPINELILVTESDTYHLREWTEASAAEDVNSTSDDLLTQAIYEQDRLFIHNIVQQDNRGPVLTNVLETYNVAQQVQDQLTARLAETDL
jgi:2-hydroxy-4-carboxymuconate semialdehyde hemiacetal dehydrogenase